MCALSKMRFSGSRNDLDNKPYILHIILACGSRSSSDCPLLSWFVFCVQLNEARSIPASLISLTEFPGTGFPSTQE
jgi:hypothetical protein